MKKPVKSLRPYRGIPLVMTATEKRVLVSAAVIEEPVDAKTVGVDASTFWKTKRSLAKLGLVEVYGAKIAITERGFAVALTVRESEIASA